MDDQSRAFQMPLESQDHAPAREFSMQVAQLSLTDGIWQDQPDHLGAFTAERLGPNARGRGSLFVLVDVSGETEGRAEIERELVEQVRDAYAAGRGSVSFGLTEALRAANRYLHDVNRNVAREERRMAGVTAVSIRGTDVYIAQAGPALAYIYSGELLSQFPARSPWLEEDSPSFGPDSDASVPLGVQLEFTGDLAHATLEEGNRLVLAMRSLAQLVSPEELQDALADKTLEELAAYFESVASDTDMAAMLVEIKPPVQSPTPARTESKPTITPPTREPISVPAPIAGPTPRSIYRPPAPMQAAEEPTPRGRAAEETPEQKLERLREERRRRRGEQPGVKLPGVRFPSLAPLRNGLAGLINRWSALNKNVNKSPTVQRATKQTNRALNTAFGALGNLLRQAVFFVLPGVPERERVVPKRVSSEPIWMKIVVLILPLIFVGLALGMFTQQAQAQERKFEGLVAQAKQLVTESDGASDRTLKRSKLTDAQAVLRDAQKIHAEDNRISTVYYQVQDKLNELDGVSVLYSLTTLVNYSDSKAKPSHILAHENDIFVFDRGTQHIYRYVLNDAGTGIRPFANDGSILNSGDKPVPDQRAVGELVDIAWADPGGNLQTGILVTVDGAGLVATFDPAENKWRATQVEARVWSPPNLIGTFSGNLYAVAPQKNQILRFVPTLAGYTQVPTNYFSANVDLTRVVNMAIDADVWLVRNDGSLTRYRTGSPAAFNMSDNAPANIVAVFTSLTTNSVYVADGANQRLVQFDKNGRFQRQIKPATQQAKAFNGLVSLYVDELKSKIYLLNGTGAYMANLPK